MQHLPGGNKALFRFEGKSEGLGRPSPTLPQLPEPLGPVWRSSQASEIGFGRGPGEGDLPQGRVRRRNEGCRQIRSPMGEEGPSGLEDSPELLGQNADPLMRHDQCPLLQPRLSDRTSRRTPGDDLHQEFPSGLRRGNSGQPVLAMFRIEATPCHAVHPQQPFSSRPQTNRHREPCPAWGDLDLKAYPGPLRPVRPTLPYPDQHRIPLPISPEKPGRKWANRPIPPGRQLLPSPLQPLNLLGQSVHENPLDK